MHKPIKMATSAVKVNGRYRPRRIGSHASLPAEIQQLYVDAAIEKRIRKNEKRLKEL